MRDCVEVRKVGNLVLDCFGTRCLLRSEGFEADLEQRGGW
jgi:hypothetical protein